MQFDQLKRREFITLLCGAAAAWPLAARAQQLAKLPTIGFLGASTSSNWSHWTAAFVQRLRELGWIEGRTVAIEYRWAEGRSERFTEIAAEFARLKVDVILSVGSAAAVAKQATSTIPIVFALAADPVGSGLVASLARPGGNLTGLSILSSELAGKRIELLREVLPGLRRLAIIGNVGSVSSVLEIAEAQAAARKLGLDVDVLEIRRAEEIAPAFGTLKSDVQALYVCPDPLGQRQPRSHQHLGARRATADDSALPRLSWSGRFHVLRSEQRGPVPPRRRLCRQNSARGKAGRPPRRAADQVRSRHQSDHRQGAWADDPGIVSAARRRGDRVRRRAVLG
jgi:ABC-type uncharacterized transport system substrate-binding protein